MSSDGILFFYTGVAGGALGACRSSSCVARLWCMRALLLLFFATPALAAGSIYEQFWNVRAADVIYLNDGDAMVYVIWRDADDWQKTSEEICASSISIRRVQGASVASLNKANGNVIAAAQREPVSGVYCER